MTDDTTDELEGSPPPETAPRRLTAAEKKFREPLVAECQRIRENAQHTAAAHFRTSERLARHHNALGSVAVVVGALLAAKGGSEIFGQRPDWVWLTPVLSLLAAVTTGLLTFLKTSERQARHLTAAHAFKTLENQARRLATVDAEFEPHASFKKRMETLCERWDSLGEQSPPTVDPDFEWARARIAEGVYQTEVDRKLAEARERGAFKTPTPPSVTK
ncbi:MAG TPA: SLATT domain-containing protein [Archangium sp.]|nr:SLATT domain-containing protein [Archangium sp.]